MRTRVYNQIIKLYFYKLFLLDKVQIKLIQLRFQNFTAYTQWFVVFKLAMELNNRHKFEFSNPHISSRPFTLHALNLSIVLFDHRQNC